ncbi:hypothetical protein ILUMI_22030 [Ignelater luminosus]|uniref:HAT C-terminal dimerisation domain-containing protein n=1 Tax=Ignelater luminosus TaxID=2038154 RepID=A0A8K0CFA6_IGNLU|nr:hypothetical protein ILUMI_22030 [Ignelater luminosus]
MMNFFTDELQTDRARQYVLLEGLVSDCNTSSDESARSSSVQSKHKRTDEPGQSIHTSFWECYDKVVAENFTDDHSGTASTLKNTIASDLDKYLSMKTIKRTDNPFAWWATHKSKFSECIVKLAAKHAKGWVLEKAEIGLLEIWERKILQAIYGGINTEVEWRRRTNEELENIYKESKITTVIKTHGYCIENQSSKEEKVDHVKDGVAV